MRPSLLFFGSYVNPDHLEPVTQKENQRRKSEHQIACKRGHAFDAQNTYANVKGMA